MGARLKCMRGRSDPRRPPGACRGQRSAGEEASARSATASRAATPKFSRSPCPARTRSSSKCRGRAPIAGRCGLPLLLRPRSSVRCAFRPQRHGGVMPTAAISRASASRASANARQTRGSRMSRSPSRPGEILALTGPSGSGKTTLCRIIGGLEQPDAGVVTLGGLDVTPTPCGRRRVAFVFESYALYPQLSVFDNVASPLRAPNAERGAQRIEGRSRLSWSCSRSPIWPTAFQASCQVARSSASRSPGRWCRIRPCSCSTNRSPI